MDSNFGGGGGWVDLGRDLFCGHHIDLHPDSIAYLVVSSENVVQHLGYFDSFLHAISNHSQTFPPHNNQKEERNRSPKNGLLHEW